MIKFEREILEEIAGRRPPSAWGAAVGVALEFLYHSGYITSKFGGYLTDKGRKALDGQETISPSS